VSATSRVVAAVAALVIVSSPRAAWPQEWRASARVGRVTYEGAPTGASDGSSAVLGLDRTGTRDWFGASAAIPLGDDPFWAVLGGWKRLSTRGSAGLLLDLTGRGFIQRHNTTTTGSPAPTPGPLPFPAQPSTPRQSDQSGQGVGTELMAGAFTGSSTLRIESRAGVAAQSSRLGDARQERTLPTGDARLSLIFAPLTLQAESRAWLDDTTTHAYLGATLQYARGPLQLWGSLGGWAAGGINRTAWSAGIGTALAPGVELQFGGRGNTYDPLYHSATETSIWGGLSLRLGGGGSRMVAAPVPARGQDGRAVISLSARATRSVPAIAGDFTGWKPVPMQREGSRWTYTAKLKPGVYHYSFVAEDGTWFVPQSQPGRQSDGMGGYVAVLVVS
jgi:hypothetical protein